MAKQPYLIYQANVGDTPDFYNDCIDSVARYCYWNGYMHIVQTEPLLKISPIASQRSANANRLGYLPIYEKENAFKYFDRYEKVAVLDADIYIRDNAPRIFAESDADFAGVIEREMPLTGEYFTKIRKYSEGQYRRLDDVDWRWNADGAEFFNMGVMVMDRGIAKHLRGDTPEQFVRRPEFERFVNGEGHWRWSTDQTLLNWWVKKSGMTVKHLDWRWNALYGGVRDVTQAYFVHFFLSAKMPCKGAEIPEIIRSL
jgi:hypothetical protein